MQKTSGTRLRTFNRPSQSSGARFLPLVASVLTFFGLCPAPASAQAPNVTYSGPLIISRGGTYTGNFRSTDSNTPVIQINTSEPVTIENCILTGAGDIIWANNGGANLTIRNNQAYGLTPTVDNRGRGRFVAASSARNLNVTSNYLEHTTGFTIYQWSGDGSPSQTVTILRNKIKNIDGRHRNGGFTMANFVGLNTVRNTGNIEIAWNQVINEPDQSSVEDNINFYNSGGTSSSPARVHDNYVQGAYPLPATHGTFSGTGMTTDGDGNSASTTAAFIQAYNNQFISTCNAAMNIAAGHDIRYYNNRMITSSYLPDGRKLNGTYAATAIFNAYQQPSSVMYNNSVDNNVIGFVKDGYNTPYANRHDLSTGACANCPNNTHLPNPITVQTEQGEFTLWTQKLSQNGITLGVGGSGTSGGSTAPTAPAPPTTPTGSGNTGSTPMAGPNGYTFFRGLNLNGGALTLDGHNWEAASGAAGVSVSATPYSAPNVALNPNTDASRADMIRNFVYGRNVTASIGNVANGTYGVYLYVWEDNNAETYDISVQGQKVRTGFNSGSAGSWQRMGPFTANVTNGAISVTTAGGDANLSGIEIWKQSTATTNQNPTVTLTAAASVTVNTALSLAASANDPDGTVAKVEFFNGSTKLGEDTSAPYTLSYTPTATGTLTLAAKATDNAGGTATSTAVNVTVAAAPVVTPPTSGGGTTSGPAGYTFFRGLNVNGAALTLDGHNWEAGNAANVRYSGASPLTSNVALNPATDAGRTDLIRSFIWGHHVTASVAGVTNGSYAVYLYLFEDNNPETYDISVEGQKVRAGFNSGSAGSWQRVGPFTANVTDGNVTIDLQGGAANLSGIEIWKQSTTTTTPPTTTPTATSTLFRAINVNGSASTIDGLSFEAGTSPANVSTNGIRLTSPNVTPNPATDAARAGMLRSFVYGQSLRYAVTNVPNGTYDVAYYFFEDNAAETFGATVNGQAVLTNYNSGPAGTWRKTTPVRVTVTNGQILLQTSGGYANLSGVEIFKVQ